MDTNRGGCESAQLSEFVAAWTREVVCAAAVFFWRQPFRSRAVADSLASSKDERGVLLIHGFFCNRGLWNPWMRVLQARRIPFIAVNLEPAFAPIESFIRTIDAAAERLEVATGRPPIVVAHSMGGLAVRAWLAETGPRNAVHCVITIGTPHKGTWLARFSHTVNGRQMRRSSTWLEALEAKEQCRVRPEFICFRSNCDNIVFPTC